MGHNHRLVKGLKLLTVLGLTTLAVYSSATFAFAGGGSNPNCTPPGQVYPGLPAHQYGGSLPPGTTCPQPPEHQYPPVRVYGPPANEYPPPGHHNGPPEREYGPPGHQYGGPGHH